VAVDRSVEKPTTISKFRVVFAEVAQVCFVDPFTGNPWIHFYNSDIELYLFYYLKA
jgi:hypothetical protein